MNSSNKRRRTAELHTSPRNSDLIEAQKVNDLQLKSRFESICRKYGRDFHSVSDEIDLRTGRIVINNGHLEGIGEPYDPAGFLENEVQCDDDQTGIETEFADSMSRSPGRMKAPGAEIHWQTKQHDTYFDNQYEARRETSTRLGDIPCRDNYSAKQAYLRTMECTREDRGGCYGMKDLCVSNFSGKTRSGHGAYGSLELPSIFFFPDDKGHFNGRRHDGDPLQLVPTLENALSVLAPKLNQPSVDQAEPTPIRRRTSRSHKKQLNHKSGSKGMLRLDTSVRSATRADSDSDDPLHSDRCPLSTPSIIGSSDERTSKKENARFCISPNVPSKVKFNCQTVTRKIRNAERVQSELFTNLDIVQVVASGEAHLSPNLQTSQSPFVSGRIAKSRSNVTLAPDEAKHLVNLRIMEKKPWSIVLAAMPRRSPAEVKHWYYTYCVGGKNEPVSSRPWTSEEKKKVRSFQPSHQPSWEAILAHFPERTITELQYEWIQACRDSFSGPKKNQTRYFCGHVTAEERAAVGNGLNRAPNTFHPAPSPTLANGRPDLGLSTQRIKSESPDPLVGDFETPWPLISRGRVNV